MLKTKRALSLLLVVLMTLSMVVGVNAAEAVDGRSGGRTASGGLELSKYYDPETGLLTLEAYATGSSVTVMSTEPLDIVLVLDVSGSMRIPMSESDAEEVYGDEISTENYGMGHFYKKSDGSFAEALYWGGKWQDEDGNTITPKSSSAFWSSGTQFYKAKSTGTRLYKLQQAVNSFITEVGERSPESKIALVKFASDKKNDVGNDLIEPNSSSPKNYSQIVCEFTVANETGINSIKSEVNKLTPYGQTHADYGMQHAVSLLQGNTESKNKKIVIMFTDGIPGISSKWTAESSVTSENDKKGTSEYVANETITASKTIKELGASVYTIGYFFNPPSSGDNLYKYLNYVSSNYKDARSMTNPGTQSGTNYYRVATDESSLNDIFTTISDEIGGATDKTLSSETVLKDIVSEYFDIPADKTGDIKVYTRTCTAIDSDGKPTAWGELESDSGITLNMSGKTVTVTGFDYSTNWVGSHNGRAGGKKLVLQIPIEDNGTGMGVVPTNGAESGIYLNDELVLKFAVPKYEFPCYTVVHVQSGENVGSDQYRIVDGKGSLTDKVTDGYLYGGAFDALACGEDDVQAFADGESAISFSPEKYGMYYIWEVDDKYLIPKTTAVIGHCEAGKEIRRLYLMTPIDRELYMEVGFCVEAALPVGDRLSAEDSLYEYIDVTKDSEPFKQIYVKNGAISVSAGETVPNDRDDGYIGIYRLTNDEFGTFKEESFKFKPYWITLDGIKVTGAVKRECTYPESSPSVNGIIVNDVTDASICVTVDALSVEPVMLSLSYSYDEAIDDVEELPIEPVEPEEPVTPPVADELTITLNDNGTVYEISAEVGDDLTGKVKFRGAEDQLFAGWYVDEDCTVAADFSDIREDMTVYSKYVSDKYLQVKYTEKGLFKIRSITIISAIDSSISESGFIVNGNKIASENKGNRYGFYSAKNLFDVDSNASLIVGEYSLSNASNGDEIAIMPYWVTPDGTTVYGMTRTLIYNKNGLKG